MNLPIDQLIKPLSAEEVKESIYNLMKASGLQVKSWQEGAVARTIIAVIAAVIAGFTEVIAVVTRSGFLDLSEGVWLTLLAWYVYGVERPEATYATGKLILNNNAGKLYQFDPGDLIVKNPASNKTYTNADTVTLNPLEKGKVITIRAQEAGVASTAAPGQISELVTKYLGVTCTNPEALIGQDAMSDPELRELCRLSLGALSPNGPAAAYEFVAKSSKRADKSPVGVNRVYIPPAPGDGTVTVYVATATGAVPGDVNDPSTDLGLVNRRIQTLVVPHGVTAFVKSAVPKSISINTDVYVSAESNQSVAGWKTDIERGIQKYLEGVPIGGFVIAPSKGKVPWRAVVGAIEGVSPYIIEATLTTETDIMLAQNEVVVFAMPSINVHVA